MTAPDDAPDLSPLPLNPEFVPGTPEFEEKRARLRYEVRVRLDRGEGRLEVEDWLTTEGLDPGDAGRLVDAVVRPPAATGPLGLSVSGSVVAEAAPHIRRDKPVTDPEFAFAADATSADHVLAKVKLSWYLFRLAFLVPVLAVAAGVLHILFKGVGK